MMIKKILIDGDYITVITISEDGKGVHRCCYGPSTPCEDEEVLALR